MMWLVWFTAMVAALAFTAAGYLFGARSGRVARRELEERAQARESDVARLETALSSAGASTQARVDAEVAQAEARGRDAIAKSTKTLEADNAAYKTQIARLEAMIEEIRKQASESTAKQIEAMLKPMLKKGDADVQTFRAQMKELLSPMLDRERLNRELSQIDMGSGSLGELPRFLESIASKGGFDALVLSDEAGLPLAANRGADRVDELAGFSAMFLALADRIAAQGPSTPTALVIRDASDQLAIHRIFRAGTARFLLSGITRGANLAPGALDPALGKLERLLQPQAVA